MVNSIGGSGAGRAAIEAALKSIHGREREMGVSPDASMQLPGTAAAPETGFAEALKKGVGAVETQVAQANEVHIDAVNGDLDLHEVAAQLKESEITFQFALTVRNKLMDAYREVMRMSI